MDGRTAKEHYSYVLEQIIQDVEMLRHFQPASKMSREIMRERKEQCQKRIQYLASFLGGLHVEIEQISIDEQEAGGQ